MDERREGKGKRNEEKKRKEVSPQDRKQLFPSPLQHEKENKERAKKEEREEKKNPNILLQKSPPKKKKVEAKATTSLDDRG